MSSPTNQESLAASQRLLDYIAGGRSAPAAASDGATASATSPQADGPAAAAEGAGRFARPLKSISQSLSRDTRSVIGLTCDAEGVMLSRTHHLTMGDPYLEGVRFAPYPAGTDAADLTQRVACAVAALKSFAPDYSRCRIVAAVKKSDVCLLTLPNVKEEERDAVALLKAGQQSKFDAADVVFDYRVRAGAPKGSPVEAIGLVASRQATEDLVAAFKKLGVTLSGVVSPKLAPAILLTPGFSQIPWRHFASLHVSDDVSILSLFANGRLVQQRTINFGRSLFLSKVMEQLGAGSLELTTESGKARLLHAASALMANPQPTDAERSLLAASLGDGVQRMVSYITRTVNYYQRVEKGQALEGLFVTASHGVEQALHAEVERQLGLASQPYAFTAPRSPAADAGIVEIVNRFKTATLTDAIGVGFSFDDRIPNLLEPPDVRRTNRRFALVRRGLAIAVGAASAVLIAAGLYFAWGWMSAHEEAALKEKQLAALTKPLTPGMLKSETAKLASLEREGADLLKKRRFAALMAEIAAIKGDDIFITNMTLTDAAAEAAPRGRGNRSKSLEAATGRRVLTISAELFQTPQERETALAQFLNRLETSLKDAVITVRRDAAAGSGFPVVIRMEGSF